MQLLHERIKIARNTKGLSQKRMAELLGISQPGYQQIESGKYPDMKISTFIKLCDFLDVSADWLLGFVDENPHDTITRFYMDILDIIIEYGDNDLIEDNTTYKLTMDLTKLKNKYDIE